MSLNQSCCTGSDGIPTKVLRIAANYVASPIACIINKSFEQGIFPSKFRIAKVIPVFKNGNSDYTENYRPIFLLNNLCKITEKAIYVRIFNFLMLIIYYLIISMVSERVT